MAQATFSVRMDEELKEQFDTLCKEFGMNTSTAINIFARTVVREKRIPFDITTLPQGVTRDQAIVAFNALRTQAKENGVYGMSLEDINKEIESARK